MAQNFVIGAKEIERALGKLSEELAEKVVLDALRAGAEVIADDARERIKTIGAVDTGVLAEHIRVRQRRAGRGKSAPKVISIGIERVSKQVVRKGRKKPSKASPSKYAHLVEFGTEHSAPKPFLRPALDNKGDAAISAIAAEISDGLERAARKLGRRL